MKAYLLSANKELEIVNNSWLYDVEEDFTSKKDYIAVAKKMTEKANKQFGTNFTYKELFGDPVDNGYRYCKRCGSYYWADDHCECD